MLLSTCIMAGAQYGVRCAFRNIIDNRILFIKATMKRKKALKGVYNFILLSKRAMDDISPRTGRSVLTSVLPHVEGTRTHITLT